METRKLSARGFSAIQISAALSVALLIGGLVVYTHRIPAAKAVAASDTAVGESATADENQSSADYESILAGLEASSTDPGSTELGQTILGNVVGTYLSLSDRGFYTPEVGQAVGEQMATTLKAPIEYKTYVAAGMHISADTSASGTKAYNDALTVAVAPLRTIDQPEFETFAYYLDTKDTSYLRKLADTAQLYHTVARNAAAIAVPANLLPEHLALVNAYEKFGSALDTLTANADDPYGAAAALSTYNDAERGIIMSSTALAQAYKAKTL